MTLRLRWLVPVLALLWVLYTFGPILGMLLSTFLGERLGCAVNEGGSAPCLLFGVDIGGLLYLMFMGPLLALITVPTGLMAGLAGLVYLGVYIFSRPRTRP